MIKLRKILGLFLVATVGAGLAAQSQAPVPIAPPPDVLTSQAASASALTNYKGWVETSLASHDATIQNLWSAKVTDEATIQSQSATIQFQGDHLTRQDAQIATMQAQIAVLQAQLMPVIPAVLHIEAESAAASGSSIFSQATTDAGGGLNLSNIVNGQWYEYHINVPVAGAYNMTIRAATPRTAETVHIEFPVGTNASGPVAIANTGGYQVWTTAPVGQPITFPAGTVVFRVVCDTGALNLNWYEFVRQQ